MEHNPFRVHLVPKALDLFSAVLNHRTSNSGQSRRCQSTESTATESLGGPVTKLHQGYPTIVGGWLLDKGTQNPQKRRANGYHCATQSRSTQEGGQGSGSCGLEEVHPALPQQHEADWCLGKLHESLNPGLVLGSGTPCSCKP